MHIAICSPVGAALPWWVRLKDEGNDVRVWVKDPGSKTIGDGIVDKAGQWPELLAWAKECAQKREPTLVFFDFSGMGEAADEARRWGLPVIGGGAFADRLENDRDFGFKIAREAGCALPPYQEFGTLTETIEFARKNKLAECYWKTDRFIDTDATQGCKDSEHVIEYLEDVRAQYGDCMKNMLQKKVDGTPISTARWWNGLDWVGPFEGTYENKKLMNDDVGPSTGCSFNAVWFYDEERPVMAERLHWDALALAFRQNNAPPGIYDVNAVVDEAGQAWFLEWTPRLGFDAEPCSSKLISDLGKWLYGVAQGQALPAYDEALVYSVRLSIPPYPWKHGERSDKGGCDGTPVRGIDGLWQGKFSGYCIRHDGDRYEIAGPEGEVGLAIAVGYNIHDLHDEAIAFADTLRPKSLQYRTDGGDDCAQAAEKLAAAGVEVHMGLLT